MSAPLAAGTILFGYEISKLLGQGGMGTVYLCRQVSLNRPVALKVLHPHLLRNPAAVEVFLREARASARLNHPHLVACHDAHADPDHQIYCYSMEYVPGRSVTQMMRSDGVMQRPMALHIAYQIASALGSAHQHGLVHRDVKPDNIMVTNSAVAKLLDLGLARDRLGGEASTNSGMRLTIVGTPEFSAPEQCRNPDLANAASDVYSLGATVFYLLTGRPPFMGETVIDLIVRKHTEPLIFPEAVPEDCRPLLELMMALDPTERLPHGAAVVAALESLAQGLAPNLPATSDEDQATGTETQSHARRRMRRLRRFR